MLNPPDGLRPDMLTETLAEGWGLDVTSLRYLPLGFGSHHWEAADADKTRWFVTVDELSARRKSPTEPIDGVYDRLNASLATAMRLSDLARTFVAAPVPTASGDPLIRATDRFTVALYPFIDGQSFRWGEFQPPEHRRALLEMIISVHTAPAAASEGAMTDDLSIDYRDELDAALAGAPGMPDSGPYGQPTAELVACHREAIRQSLAWYDAVATQIRRATWPMVLTHGEPHPGNTMLSETGWLFIDWDTALISAPERDLFDIDPGDGSLLTAYQRATGTNPRPEALTFFRLRWDLTDIALAVGQFRAPHTGDANDAKSFGGLGPLLAKIARQDHVRSRPEIKG